MSNITAKTSSNIFYQARCAASAHNEQLSSREGAADMMAIDRGCLYRMENGITNPYPEEVLLMADCYHAPELKSNYCREMCPLGKDFPKVDNQDLDRITVRAQASFRRITEAKELLLDITEDGVISEDEKDDLNAILKTLDEVNEITQSLKLWVEKNMK
ncbi:MAG: XRE family transcriptional regulator [Lachnospiraceae bacterium]|nr:XRE family transcriptional regulator [Lachnospiraceae bacterium]